MLLVAPHTKESVVACNVRFASLLVHGLVLNLVKNPCRSEHATILSVLNILLLDVKTPRWWWTSSRACVKQPKVSFRKLSNCAKVGKNSVSRLSPPCIFPEELRLLTNHARSEKRPATLAPAERGAGERHIRSFNRVCRRAWV